MLQPLPLTLTVTLASYHCYRHYQPYVANEDAEAQRATLATGRRRSWGVKPGG